MQIICKNMTENQKLIIEQLKKQGLTTPQSLADSLPQMDQATVYRNLNKFVEKGIVREIKIRRGISNYELIEDEHQHFICNKCDEIKPLHINSKDLKSLIENSDIIPEDFELNVRGQCRDCK
jgi:Fe2+ or Zn2+ uptake regulation protein